MKGIKVHLVQMLLVLALAVPLLLIIWHRPPATATGMIPAHSATPVPKREADAKSVREHEIKALAKALKENPGHTPVLMKLAKLESEKGSLTEARKHLEEILGREPDNPEARLELGKILYQRGDIRGALDQTLEILKKHPSHPDALYNLGAMYGNIGNKERAAEYWKRLIASDPNSESGRLASQMLPRLEARGR